MRKNFLYVFAVVLLMAVVTGSCSNKGGGGGGNPGGGSEVNLGVTLNPPAGSTQPAAPQTDFPLTVTIATAMPSQGVTIDVNAKKDDGSGAAPFYSESRSSSGAVNNFTITNTPTGVISIVTVTVTSKTKATNTVTLTYRYSRKP